MHSLSEITEPHSDYDYGIAGPLTRSSGSSRAVAIEFVAYKHKRHSPELTSELDTESYNPEEPVRKYYKNVD